MARTQRTVSILMLEDSEGLGHVGDVVDVKAGYARNYLFPSGRACAVTKSALQKVERAKERAVKQRVAQTKLIAEAAGSLEGLSLTIEERASEEGHLFGSVGAAQIVAALAEQGVTVEEKHVNLEHPLKELGIYNVPITLDADHAPEVRVWIVELSE